MSPRTPDFLLIGAQKAGTTWLWAMLRDHPGTQLPDKKEIHHFGCAEYCRAGIDPYLAHFASVAPDRITGEASTALFVSRAPFWFNEGRTLEYDDSLPTVPELVRRDLGEPKIVVILRDPVRRAVSAYRHWLRSGNVSPLLGLRRAALAHPKLRLLEYGDYAEHMQAWRSVFPEENMLVLIYEQDVRGDPASGLGRVFSFLGLDETYRAPAANRRVHASWTWSRSVVRHLAGPLGPWLVRGRLGGFIDRHDFLRPFALRDADIAFLRERYLPQRQAVAELTGRNLDCWDYGAGLLTR